MGKQLVEMVGAGLRGKEGKQGPRGLNWCGDYNPTRIYSINDAVFYSGSSFICTLACQGVLPSVTQNWSIFAGGELGDIDCGTF